jgi:hypothetical protein
MRVQKDSTAARQNAKQLWIGMVEVRALSGQSEILDGGRGAFVNIVTWALDAEEYRRNAELVISDLGDLFVSEVVNPEPVGTRSARMGAEFSEEVEDMISRAQGNPKAIIYGTFYSFKRDNA